MTTLSEFRKYDHLERLGGTTVRGILDGRVHVFPKIDGTNASVWSPDGNEVLCASRNRVLSEDADNAGFHAWLHSDSPMALNVRRLARAYSRHIFYGEWLVPHTLKTYHESAWRRFYIFDVYNTGRSKYENFNDYIEALAYYKTDFIRPMCVLEFPSVDAVEALTEANTYLIPEGRGVGEGIVLKNYDWRNKFGQQPWAKIVRQEFKASHRPGKEGPPGKKAEVEGAIVEAFVTEHLVSKTLAKVALEIMNEQGVDVSVHHDEFVISNRGRIIPQLLGRTFYDLVTEHTWDALKKHKNPTIDFKLLQKRCTEKVKEHAKELF